MDKWQFMNLSSLRFNLDGVDVNTRTVINEFIKHWIKAHADERWTASTVLEFAQNVEILCKSLDYSITLKREDDNMRVIVHGQTKP